MDWTTRLELGAVLLLLVLSAVQHVRQRRRQRARRAGVGASEANAAAAPIEPAGSLSGLIRGLERAEWLFSAVGGLVAFAGVLLIFLKGGLSAWILLGTGVVMLVVSAVWYLAGKPIALSPAASERSETDAPTTVDGRSPGERGRQG